MDALKGHILLAEHEKLVSSAWKDFLEERGHTVIIEEWGDQVAYRMKQEKPDVVVLDFSIPKKDGFQILQERMEDPELLKIPVVALTEQNKVAEIQKMGELGIIEYFHNTSAEPDQLCDTIEKLLNG